MPKILKKILNLYIEVHSLSHCYSQSGPETNIMTSPGSQFAVQDLRPPPPAEPDPAAEQSPGEPPAQASGDTAWKDPSVLV